MRTLIATLVASTVSMVAFQAAHAADAIDEVPQAPAAEYSEPVSTGNWAGGYAGGTASWQRGKFNAQGNNNANGFGGGVYGGYNMQSGQMVYGGEADLNYSGIDSSNAGLTAKQGVNGSIRGRVGIDLNPVLVYGTAGVAGTSAEMKNAVGKDDRNLVGWTAGAGVEAFVTNNITARVEYRYTDYSKKDFNVGGTNVRSGLEDHSVRVGMGVKF
ncbi:outer membrane protein [Shinella zoogloeoides]|jgi:outer membrane immunogenic protein|uniref:outer membrane protein n=1 Tax=Shinella zoogloeoides TaxID=352475 RepID=UPI00273FDC1A|nr:outer membrane protein [Shinella zoogloeoides]WLR93835.1 porin family protein [Shinella zoogloeoides]